MEAQRHRLVGIYLNDHLVGATAAVGRARMARDANAGTEFGDPLIAVCREIEEDRSTLESVMEEVAVGRSRTRPAIGWLGERLGRLKTNGQIRGYSPLSRIIDLEVLLLAITGKLRLWNLLAELLEDESSADLPALIERAEDQRARIEELQLRAASLL